MALQRIDLHQQHVFSCRGPKQREDRWVAEVTTVPIGYAIDLDRAEQIRQAGGSYDRIDGDLVVGEDAQPPGLHVGRGDEDLRAPALPHRLKISRHRLDQVKAPYAPPPCSAKLIFFRLDPLGMASLLFLGQGDR